MAPKLRPTPSTADLASRNTRHMGRDGLGAYIASPTDFPSSRVVYYNDKFVVINDLYPKSAVHLLILPRDGKKNRMMPQDAFEDPLFLEECRAEEKKVRGIVAEELRRRYGVFSAIERERNEAMEAEEVVEELPQGRDWEKEVMSGIHAVPSMSHLHIHVMSRDMCGEAMKKRNHYQSFTTDFFVPLEDFPMEKEDVRRPQQGRHREWRDRDLVCWRCGRVFETGQRGIMEGLKAHLEEEFEEWKKE